MISENCSLPVAFNSLPHCDAVRINICFVVVGLMLQDLMQSHQRYHYPNSKVIKANFNNTIKEDAHDCKSRR